MFNDIQIFSRENMIYHSAGIKNPCVIVSISDKDAAPPDFYDNDNIWDVCQLFFDDEEAGPTCMTEQDADTLVAFIRQYENEDIDLFVHCNGGVSRSAGCAAAIMLIDWGDDSAIFQDGKYCPNMHCYRYVLNAADVSYDDIALARKQRGQLAHWYDCHADDLE